MGRPRARGARAAVLLALPLLALAGCSVIEAILAPTPPLLPTRWANAARAVISPATPQDTRHEVRAEHGPTDARRTRKLCSLTGRSGLGDVRVELGAGVHTLCRETLVELGGASFVLEGAGPHRTRLELDTDSLRSLTIAGAGRVELRGLTVAGTTGGGIFIEGCPDVVVEDAHFAGSRYGLALRGSTAAVSTSVFAGCEHGVDVRDGSVAVSETAFMECWKALSGTRASFSLSASAFVDNRTVLEAGLDRRSRIDGCLFAGEKQELGWRGRPGLAARNLALARELGDRLGVETNRELRAAGDFPEQVSWPGGFDVPAVHFALERARLRGERDPADGLRAVALEKAELLALASQRALKAQDLAAARTAAEFALRYWGDRSLDEAPEALLEVAELAQ